MGDNLHIISVSLLTGQRPKATIRREEKRREETQQKTELRAELREWTVTSGTVANRLRFRKTPWLIVRERGRRR